MHIYVHAYTHTHTHIHTHVHTDTHTHTCKSVQTHMSKCTVLSIEDKITICECLDNGSFKREITYSYTSCFCDVFFNAKHSNRIGGPRTKTLILLTLQNYL